MPYQWQCCWYCGCELVFSKKPQPRQRTVDHVTPKWMGGDKLVDACRQCNNLKGESSVDQFREWLGVERFVGEEKGWEPW